MRFKNVQNKIQNNIRKNRIEACFSAAAFIGNIEVKIYSVISITDAFLHVLIKFSAYY